MHSLNVMYNMSINECHINSAFKKITKFIDNTKNKLILKFALFL